MPYITYDDLILRYPIISTWPGSETTVNSDLIYYGEMELNSRLAGHFTVPFSAAHPTIKDLAIDLSYYRAIRLTDPEKADKIKAQVSGRIDAIKAGDEYIYTGSGTTIAADPDGLGVWSTNEDYHPVHGMLEPEDSCIDADRLDDEADERD